MNRVEYNEFVRQIENQYHGKPEQLASIAKRYIGLSYGYLALIVAGTILLLLALGAWMIFSPNALSIKIGIFGGIALLVFLFSVIKGLRVKTLPPDGLSVSREDSPLLYELLDDLRENVADSKFDKVLINGDFNAAVCQFPRLGLLGWYRSYLVLGLPLMQVLSTDEFKSVLAHEFSHLSNKDGSSGNWIYRIRVAWEQIMMSIQESGGAWALAPFITWFWPRFNAHAFVLSRQHEYRADGASIEYVGVEAMASSLQKVEFYARLIDELGWVKLFDEVNEKEQPPENPYNQLRELLLKSPSEFTNTDQWMNQAFARPTDYSDTHPALKDRLLMADALPETVSSADVIVIPAVDLNQSSAVALFGKEKEQEMMQKLNKEWVSTIEPIWKFRHEYVKDIRSELGKEEDVNDVESAWKWAGAMLDMSGPDAAMPWIEKTLSYDPKHIGARFSRGCYLIEKNDSRGVPILEQVAEEDPQYGLDALGMLKMHYSNRGDFKNYEAIDQRADQFDQLLDKAQQERIDISGKDSFVDHGMKPKMFEKLHKELKGFDYIKSCYIARKSCEYFPASPCYIIIIVPKTMTYISDSSAGQIAEEIEPFMQGYYLVCFSKQNKSVAKKVMALSGSDIFE